MRLHKVVVITALLGLGLITPSARGGPESDFRWHGVVDPGQAIEINGIKGNIRAEATSGREVEVIARKHATNSNPDEVQIRMLKHGDGVTICAVYPRGDEGPPNECERGEGKSHTHNNDVRVDFTVRVPVDVRLIARTVEGDVEALLLGGNVDASSVMGNIRISTTGYAVAKTIGGSINASLGNTDWPGQLQFETVTGEITLALPAKANTELYAESLTGAVTTDFPLVVQNSVNAHTVNGTIGNGGRKLIVKTTSGAITLHRST